jgi:hypothetical protein
VSKFEFTLPKKFEDSALLNPGCGQPEILFIKVVLQGISSQEENVNQLAERPKHPPATSIVYTSPGVLQLSLALLLQNYNLY